MVWPSTSVTDTEDTVSNKKKMDTIRLSENQPDRWWKFGAVANKEMLL